MRLALITLIVWLNLPSAMATVETQIVSKSLDLGFGQSVALPEGDWKVLQISSLSGSNSSHTGYVLERTHESQVPVIVVINSSTPNYWNSRFYQLPTIDSGLLGVNRYGTTETSLLSKLSFYYDYEGSEESYQRSWFQTLKISSYLNRHAKNRFFVSVARNVGQREDIQIISFIKKPVTELNGRPLSKSEVRYPEYESAILKWNESMVSTSFSSFYEKKKNLPSFPFAYDGAQILTAISSQPKQTPSVASQNDRQVDLAIKIDAKPNQVTSPSRVSVPDGPVQAFTSAPKPPQSATQVTSNPIDQQKLTSANEVWLNLNPSISIQQRQFCRIVENFRVQRSVAEQSKNEIRVNQSYRDFVFALNALIPDGKFQNWIVRTREVTQARDGSAEVFFELPCDVFLGSNACDNDTKKFYGTAPEGSILYSELAKMTTGDFAIVSGSFFYSDKKVFDKNRSVASFRTMKAASHCRAKEVSATSDFFGVEVDVISTIK